jgi:hypothetical protein
MPELRNNEFISYLYQGNMEEEDEGERAPPLAMIIEDVKRSIPMSDERTDISLATISSRPGFLIQRVKNE